MPQAGSIILDSEDIFPSITVQTTSGEKMTLPDGLLGSWSVILVYRGHF